MITAKQAYANHVRWKLYTQTEKFVHSVLDLVIMDELIRRRSIYEKQMDFVIDDILHEVFLCEEKKYGEYTVTGWRADYSKLPAELQGKHIRGLVKELEHMYEFDPNISFVCKAFKALIRELEVVREFKVNLDLEQHILTVSWDLSSTENA